MNTSTLESFISYCDDMMIANEGLKDVGKKMAAGIKKAIQWIITKLVTIKNKIKEGINKLTGKTLQDENDKLKQENAQLKHHITSLQNDMSSKNIDIKRLHAQLDDVKKALNDCKRRAYDTGVKLDDEVKTANNLYERCSQLEHDLTVEKDKSTEKSDEIDDLRTQLHESRDEGRKSSENAARAEKYHREMVKLKGELNNLSKKVLDAATTMLKEQNTTISDGRSDYWGYVEFVTKHIPLMKSTVDFSTKCANELVENFGKFQDVKPTISKLDEMATEFQSDVKAILRRDMRSYKNNKPKIYSRKQLVSVYTALSGLTDTVHNTADSKIRKLMNIHYSWDRVDGGRNGSDVINLYLSSTMKLISSIETCAQMLYKIAHLSSNVRPSSEIGHVSGKSRYSYGGSTGQYYDPYESRRRR